MIRDLVNDHQFIELEKEYKFLSRARGEGLASLPVVVVDVETTGLDFSQHELIEIGAFKLQGKEIAGVFSSLIKPKSIITPEITRLTGIDNEMVNESPAAAEILTKFMDFAGSSVLIAHNVDFDIPFLKHHFQQLLKKDLSNETICTLKLSRYLLPNLVNHKLHTVASHFNLPIANRHRAIGDVELTYQVWLQFVQVLQGKGITRKVDLDSLISRL